jgi:hypothetical protein
MMEGADPVIFIVQLAKNMKTPRNIPKVRFISRVIRSLLSIQKPTCKSTQTLLKSSRDLWIFSTIYDLMIFTK